MAMVPFVRLAPLAAIAAFGLALSGCSSFDSLNPFGAEKYETKILPDIPADDIYNEGVSRMQRGDTEGAVKRFGDIEKQHPFSQYSKKGLLLTAFAQYKGAKYDDAIASANRYYNLYPSSPDAPYVLYLAASSYYQQIPDISRDQEPAAKSLDLFRQLVDKYPKSEYVEDAKYKIQVTSDQLAGKEMSLGRYYLNRRQFTAAINRFRDVLGKYQRTRHTEEALMRLTEAYLGLGITNEAQTAAAVLGHNFPDSPWYKDAYARLQGGGLEPKEDQGSWISKISRSIGLS